MANKVILTGRLGSDPTLAYTRGGTASLSISVATTRRAKNKQDEWIDETTWHRVKAYGKPAEIIAEHFRKGSFIYIEGRISYWEAQTEKGKVHPAEIILEYFEFTGASSGAGEARTRGNNHGGDRQQTPPDRQQRGTGRESTPPADDFFDDDIPF